MQGLISSAPSIFERDEIVISKLIQGLERGKKSADMMRNIILKNCPGVKLEGFNNNDNNNNNNQDYLKELDHHSMLALDSYVTSLSMLKTCNIQSVSAGKRKLHHVDSLSANGRRDCYKRRKNGESKEEVAHMTDDGFGWRKYGQKNIQNYTHPRNYYRCTHKEDQKCQATKQVQQISNNPAKYKIIYHGNHICNNNILKTTPFIIDSPEEQSSAIVISFDGSDKVDPLLFPSSAFPTPPVRQSLDYSAVSPSSDDLTPTTSSIADSTNPVSEKSEEISVLDNCSSSVAIDNLDEDYSSIMADFPGLLPDWWTC